MNAAFTLIRRELWANRGNFYIMVAILLGIVVLASAVVGIGVGGGFTAYHPAGTASATGIAILGLVIASFVYLFYNLGLFSYLCGALWDDRKDKSVLFWRSLPVSDTATVTSKVLTAGLVGPFFVWIAVILGHLVALFALACAASARGAEGFTVFASPGALWGTWVFLAYAFVIQTLWWLPYYCWFLFISALTPRGHPFIWAILPPVVVGVVEMILNRTEYVFGFLASHLSSSPLFNGWPSINIGDHTGDSIVQSAQSANPLFSGAGAVSHFLALPSMWIGVGIAAVLFVLAIIARRYSATV